MESVLVTGGCGFIGSKIVEQLLDEGYKVHIIDNLSTGNKENVDLAQVRLHEKDINDPSIEAIFKENDFTYLIHQAAQTSVPHSIEEITFDTEVNILGSVHLIELAKKYQVEKIIFASSAAVYGDPDVLPIGEDTIAQPSSPYGLSKYTVESYLQLAARLYDLKYVILRYANVYGPKQTMLGEGGVVSIFDQLFKDGKTPTIYGNGEQTRDFIYVDDVAAANVAALKVDNEILNISCQKQTSITTLYEYFAKLYNQENKPNYSAPREGDIEHSILANDRALEKLDWQPKVELYDGLKRTIES